VPNSGLGTDLGALAGPRPLLGMADHRPTRRWEPVQVPKHVRLLDCGLGLP
jgi:hypothetical protein